MFRHTNKNARRTLVAAMAGLIIAPALPAHAARVPSCQDMTTFAGTIRQDDVWKLNPNNRSLTLPAAFDTPQFAALFGTKALDLGRPEIEPIGKAIKACMQAAAKAKNRDEIGLLRVLEGNLGRLIGVQDQIVRTQAHFDAAFKEIMDLPPSRDKLVALSVLQRAQPGGDAAKNASLFFDHDINGSNASKQVHGQVLQLMSAPLIDLRNGPDGLGKRMDPSLGQALTALASQMTEAAMQEVTALPATLEGLTKLTALEKEDHRLYDLVLPDADKAKLAGALTARNDAIQDAVLKQTTDAIAATTPDANGMNQLTAIVRGPALAALSAPRQATVRQAIAARHDAILDAMVAGASKHLAEFPATLQGLRETAQFVQQVDQGLGPSAGPARMKGFDDAAARRIADLGATAFPDFKKGIEAFPDDRQGLAAIQRAPAEVGPILGLLPATLRDQYAAVVTQKRAAIEAAVKQEDARLAALPLRGATYAESGGFMKIEFRSSDHAFLTTGGSTLDVTWQETDGHVILGGLPQGNVVLERQGGSLVGSGLRLVRQGG